MHLPSHQVSENAKRDLKEGLVLYTTENNAGLKDAWNAIQGEVSWNRGRSVHLNAGSDHLLYLKNWTLCLTLTLNSG